MPAKMICKCSECIQFLCFLPNSPSVRGQLHPERTVRRHMERDARAAAAPPQQDQLTEDHHESDDVINEPAMPMLEEVTSNPFVDPAADYDGPTIASQEKALSTFSMVVAVWLHLVAGLSREATNVVLKALRAIIMAAICLGQTLHHFNLSPSLNLPIDVTTAIKHQRIDPTIKRSICCPSCFTLFSTDACPDVCPFRETPRSRPCGAKLWREQHGNKNGPKRVPQRFYCTQSLKHWLEWLYQLPEMEDLLDSPIDHKKPEGEWMKDIWDSPAWTSFGDFTFKSGNLTFGIFIDWFNPFCNKIAGKHVSCGAIMLMCLNLPPELRKKPEYTFLVGLTPLPKEPSITTINHVLDDFVSELIDAFEVTGIVISTPKFPQGRIIRIAILPFIADTPALRKGCGFASHSARLFCCWCRLNKDDIDNLDETTWQKRTLKRIKLAAQIWKSALTHKARKECVKQYGVRWCTFQRLEYRHPSKHAVAGIMHIWFEGVLQNHFRRKFGIGIQRGERNPTTNDPLAAKEKKTAALMELDRQEAEEDLDDIAEEIREAAKRQQPEPPPRLSVLVVPDDPETEEEYDPDDDDSEDEDAGTDLGSSDSDEESSLPLAQTTRTEKAISCIFGKDEMIKIRKCCVDISLPTTIERPPNNLGEPSHGKLKADIFYVLFAIVLPAVLIEHWLPDSPSANQGMLDNLVDLVRCTHIVAAFATSESKAACFEESYRRYRQTSLELFPHAHTVPNHHFASHIPEMLRYWGPLMMVSEWSFERINGLLQKISTNNHYYEMDLTMLRTYARRMRLEALLPQPVNSTATRRVPIFPINPPEPISDLDFNNTGQYLTPHAYQSILTYLQSLHLPIVSRYEKTLAHTAVLPPKAVPHNTVECHGFTISCYKWHKGNGIVTFQESGGLLAGTVLEIWEQAVMGSHRIYFVVQPFENLTSSDASRNPFAQMLGLECRLVYATSTCKSIILEKNRVVGQLAARVRPAGTFGIPRSTTLLISLDRHRQSTLMF